MSFFNWIRGSERLAKLAIAATVSAASFWQVDSRFGRQFGHRRVFTRVELGLDAECTPEVTLGKEKTPVQILGMIALSEYGDEVTLHAVRMEALRIFETRSLSAKPWWCYGLT